MSGASVPIAPIPLARSRRRLMVAPVILAIAGVLAVAGGAVVGSLSGIVLVAAGMTVIAFSVALALVLVSVKLDVEVATLRLRWLGGERRYTLARGPVTRVPLTGPEAARLRPHFGALGWGLGRARLRGIEDVDIVRLARTDSLILIPTDHGRVGIAPASEQQLLNALAAAARIQQRMDEVAERTRLVAPPPAPDLPAAAAPPADALSALQAAASEGRPMTGIERALLEERLAAERAAALAAAEAERAAAAEAQRAAAADAARMAAFLPAEPEVVSKATEPRARRSLRVARPQWVGRPQWVRRPRPTVSLSVPRERLLAYGVLLIPVIAAAAVYLAAALQGRLDMPLAQLRPVAIALLATGPVAAAAGLVARTWFPRLVGLVLLCSLASMVLVARALLA